MSRAVSLFLILFLIPVEWKIGIGSKSEITRMDSNPINKVPGRAGARLTWMSLLLAGIVVLVAAYFGSPPPPASPATAVPENQVNGDPSSDDLQYLHEAFPAEASTTRHSMIHGEPFLAEKTNRE